MVGNLIKPDTELTVHSIELPDSVDTGDVVQPGSNIEGSVDAHIPT